MSFKSARIDGFFKVIIIGDSGVGKSSLAEYFVHRTCAQSDKSSTIGIDFLTKMVVTKDNKTIKLNIWDTAGQERFKGIVNAYFRHAQGIIICFSLSNNNTFDNIRSLINTIRIQCDNLPIIIVGTFSDRIGEREVSQKLIDELVNDLIVEMDMDIQYVEVSSKTGENVDRVFELLTERMAAKLVDRNVGVGGFNYNSREDTTNINIEDVSSIGNCCT